MISYVGSDIITCNDSGPLRAKVHGYSCDSYSSSSVGDVLVVQGARRIYHGDPLHSCVPQDGETNDASHKTSCMIT